MAFDVDDHPFDQTYAAFLGIAAQHLPEEGGVEVIGVSEVGDGVRSGAGRHPAKPRGGDIEVVIAIIPGDAERVSAQPQLAEWDQPNSATGQPEAVDVV